MQEEIDKLTNKIDLLFNNLDASGFFHDKVKDYKSFYEYSKEKYKKLLDSDSNDSAFATSNIMTRYFSELRNEILPSLKHLNSLSDLLLSIKKVEKSEIIKVDKVSKIIYTFMYLNDKYNHDECEIVYRRLIDFLYRMMERETMELDNDDIICILDEIDDSKYNFIYKIKLLYLDEMEKLNGTSSQPQDNDKLTKEDFIDLLKAKGLEYHKRETKKVAKLNDVSYGKEMSCSAFLQRTNLTPLPKNEKDNVALRNYDLINLDFSIFDSFMDKLKFKPFKNVNLSYTNAIVIPKYFHCRKPFSLEGADLEGIDMRGIDLTGVNITNANLLYTGADITGAIGKCKAVSSFVGSRKIHVANAKISPDDFKAITKQTALPCNFRELHDEFKHNMILRLYDINCVDYSKIDFTLDNFQKNYSGNSQMIKNFTLDLSYTNANINPQDYKYYNSPLLINLEGVDLRGKDFTGVEKIFELANLKKTGADLELKWNSTVTDYIED